MNDTQPSNIRMSDCAFPSLTKLAKLVSSILLHYEYRHVTGIKPLA